MDDVGEPQKKKLLDLTELDFTLGPGLRVRLLGPTKASQTEH